MTEKPKFAADILALGFGTTVAMWFVGYLCRMPSIVAPSPLVFALMMGCLVAGGFCAGRYTHRGWLGGIYAGLTAGVLNLLILGSFISDAAEGTAPKAGLWLPGWLFLAAVAGLAGSMAGSTSHRETPTWIWTATLTKVAAAATFLLIIAGGLVTSSGSGLAVVDWPNSFGYNMFLYPLSRMTGGIYYEHAHRLFGSLVGLTTVCVALHLFWVEDRKWVKILAGIAVLAVIAQGIMGGLRVTGRFTLSTSAEDTSPKLILALIHGVFGQLFLAGMACLAVVTSVSWKGGRSAPKSERRHLDQRLSLALFILFITQVLLGALQRHYKIALLPHIYMAAAILLLALVVGVRVWGLYPGQTMLQRFGGVLIVGVSIQVGLGFLALIATVPKINGQSVGTTNLEILVPTVHQAVGAILLATSGGLALWTHCETRSTEGR
jgi:cytochrome c oxidase assembly protein subunit 15